MQVESAAAAINKGLFDERGEMKRSSLAPPFSTCFNV